jgi:hypothetical protein
VRRGTAGVAAWCLHDHLESKDREGLVRRRTPVRQFTRSAAGQTTKTSSDGKGATLPVLYTLAPNQMQIWRNHNGYKLGAAFHLSNTNI